MARTGNTVLNHLDNQEVQKGFTEDMFCYLLQSVSEVKMQSFFKGEDMSCNSSEEVTGMHHPCFLSQICVQMLRMSFHLKPVPKPKNHLQAKFA